jgi:hypothetical protein
VSEFFACVRASFLSWNAGRNFEECGSECEYLGALNVGGSEQPSARQQRLCQRTSWQARMLPAVGKLEVQGDGLCARTPETGSASPATGEPLGLLVGARIALSRHNLLPTKIARPTPR